MVTYLDKVYPDAKVLRSAFEGRPGSGRDVTGYGKKIPTDYKVRLEGRLYRVYCCCFSNSGTCYVTTKNHPFLVVMDTACIP
jgi:hypothetical protein